MDRPSSAGPRQTVHLVDHPEHGQCWAVYSNGDPFLQPIDGEPIPMKIGLGGWAKGRGCWVNCGGVEADIVKAGERHARMFHQVHGVGWLVDLKKEDLVRCAAIRFEPDDGKPFTFIWYAIAVGRPAFVKKMERSKTKFPKHESEEMMWHTYTTSVGEVLTFRKGGPPLEPEVPVDDQLSLEGV